MSPPKKEAKATIDWDHHVAVFREDPRIIKVLASFRGEHFKADPSIHTELKTLLVFNNQAGRTGKQLRGPENLEAVQSALNEINSYRDRTAEIWLDATSIKAKLQRGWHIIEQVLVMKSSVMNKSQALRNSIVGKTAKEIEDLLADWEVIVKQCDMLLRNCRDAYNSIQTQVDVAKQMWFQGNRVDDSASPRKDVHYSTKGNTVPNNIASAGAAPTLASQFK